MIQRFILCALLFGFAAAAWADDPVRARRPVGPGLWYPAHPAELYGQVSEAVERADTEPRNARLRALVVPNSSYEFSADVLGEAYRLLEPGQYKRVVVLSPAHYANFRGCSIASVQLYRTPLADTWLDRRAVDRLTVSALITSRSVVYRQPAENEWHLPTRLGTDVHEREHGIEIQLPFLQVQLGKEFRLVPVLVGSFIDSGDGFDEQAFESVVEALRRVVDEDTLLVVSTNFTMYGPQYNFTPFGHAAQARIEDMDMRAIRRLVARDADGFAEYCERTGCNIPGRMALMIMMALLPDGVYGTLLDYTTSARIAGDDGSSVSYAALAFFDPSLPRAERRPVDLIVNQPGEPPPAPTQAPVPANVPPPGEATVVPEDSIPAAGLEDPGPEPVEALPNAE
jgi:hypothetical protein